MDVKKNWLMRYSIFKKNIISSKDKFYFTCPSYGFISPILKLIDEIISKNPRINIIVMSEQMKLFWEQLITNKNFKWKLILIKTKPGDRFRNILSWLKIRPFVRKLYEEKFRLIENSYFYCCGHAGDLVLFSLVRSLAMKNTVVFLNIFYSNTRKVFSIKALILLVHTWLCYGLDVTIRCSDYNRSPQIWLSERFFKKYNIELHEFNYYFNPSLLRKYNPIPDQLTSNKKIMWLDDDCSFYDKNMEYDVLACFEAIKKIIDENFAEHEVLYKTHPNTSFQSKKLTFIYSKYEKIPSYMNGDFIISNSNIKYILGGMSALLSTAAKNTNIIAISYMKLMPFKDQKIKKSFLDLWKQQSDDKIIFINSLDELPLLIKNEKNHLGVFEKSRKVLK